MARLSLLILAAMVAAAAASESRLAVTECPHHPGQCKDPETGEFHPAGTEWYHDGECQKYSCAFPEIVITGCPAVSDSDNCEHRIGDPSDGFPACCGRSHCSEGDNAA